VDRRALKITLLTWAAAACAVAVLFAWVDRPAATAAHALAGGAVFQAAGAVSELADHDLFDLALALAWITGGALALGRGLTPGVKRLLYVCVAVSAAMICGEALKWLFGRHRPVMLFQEGLYGFTWLAAKGNQHSFPSGHTFRIFSAMTALSFLWPRARLPLTAAAVLVGVSRILVTRHYPSDVLAGAVVGICAAWWAWIIIMRPGADQPPAV